MVRCPPYHPQAEGKVERSRRGLGQKIHYDTVEKRKHGKNWAKQLSDCAICLNNKKREEKGWKSPSKTYFGRKSNELVYTRLTYDGYVSVEVATKPSKKNFILHEKKTRGRML